MQIACSRGVFGYRRIFILGSPSPVELLDFGQRKNDPDIKSQLIVIKVYMYNDIAILVLKVKRQVLQNSF